MENENILDDEAFYKEPEKGKTLDLFNVLEGKEKEINIDWSSIGKIVENNTHKLVHTQDKIKFTGIKHMGQHTEIKFNRNKKNRNFSSLIANASVVLLGASFFVALYEAGSFSPILVLIVVCYVAALYYFAFRFSKPSPARRATPRPTPITFNKKSGLYWIGKSWLRFLPNGLVVIKFEDIRAVQLITSHSTEINLVYIDNSRVNLVNYSSAITAHGDAQELADFIGKPLYKR